MTTYFAGEKDTLHAGLDRHRDAVLRKLQGLDDEQLRRPMTPTGTNLLGLVKHLAAVEYGWFVEAFGGTAEPLWFDPYDDMRVAADETTQRIVAFYGRARAAADRTIAALPLDTAGRPSWRDGKVSLRWTLVHMVEETARHAGHMDILRELIDGTTGDGPPAGEGDGDPRAREGG
ncbi:DinB family protein [Streptomyces sp. NPDC048514]|uniref:DinB family protein n=1 Tax=Streptomyces sp. NPDC048514 TaxID=3365564 RepID=UPI0037240E4A